MTDTPDGQLTPAEWDRVAHIRQYTTEATPGPWTWEDWHVTGMLPHEGPNKQTLTAPAETRPEYLRRFDSGLRNKLLSDEDEAMDLRPEDARFIAEARMDVPFLLELVNRMAMWLASEHGRAEGYRQAIDDVRQRQA